MEADSVAPTVVSLEELAGTADLGDHANGLAATAEPNDENVPELSDSDDDSDERSYWTGSSDNWPSIFSVALGLASPVRGNETSKPTVATFFSGTEAPILALDLTIFFQRFFTLKYVSKMGGNGKK